MNPLFKWLFLCKVKDCKLAATHGRYCMTHKRLRYAPKEK